MAFQTGPDLLDRLDLNEDTVINPQDAQVLYYLTLAPGNLTTLLTNLNVTDPTALTDLNLLNPSAAAAAVPALDLNLDGRIDLQDVRVLYYAYRFGDILRASPSLRETLLSDLTVADEGLDADRRDAVYIDVLDRVAALVPPVTEGDHVFQVIEGTSYTLSTDDLSARDPDDAAATLIWMVTDIPDNGQLELSTDPGVAITPGMSFTQQQLEAGEVLYVHTGGDDTDDGFTVLVRNPDAPESAVQAEPVTLTVTVRPGVGLTSLEPADGFIIQGDAPSDRAGESVSGAGDVNGDGYADLIVGATRGDDGGSDAGEAYVVFGKASGFGSLDGDTNRRVLDLTGLAETDGFIIQGDVAGDQAGRTGRNVSGAGDVNGDGFADLIVGAFRGGDGGFRAGEAYVVFGKASGFGSLDGDTNRRVIDLTDLATTDGFIIQGDTMRDGAGFSVSGAGDVNGDGYADLMVGAPYGDDTGSLSSGEAYIVFGKASGFGSLDDGTNRQVVDLTGLAAADGFIIQGERVNGNAGHSVSRAGDVNGDGYADLIVGVPFAGMLGVYVVFGKAGAFGRSVTTTVQGEGTFPRQVIDLTGLTAADGFIIQGAGTNDQTGRSVSGAGDVNGDGFADLIVGAPSGDNGGLSAGEAYVVFGKADSFGSPDSANRRVIDLTTLAEADGFIIQGDATRNYAGRSVSGAGDVNGDGYADLLVGAPGPIVGPTTVGEAYVVFGKASGFGSAVSMDDPAGGSPIMRRVIDLTTLAEADGFIIQGDMDRDRAGESVSAAGDLNGDGYADLIVGAPRGDDGGGDAGEAYVIFGAPAGLTTEADAVLGTTSGDNLNADGEATVVLAGAGDDVLNIDGFGDNDLLRFDGGSGTDTLSLTGTGLSLDLSALADTRLSSIERIDLSGSGDNRLTLTRLDLLNLSEVRIDGRAELRVDGNAGDRVTVPADDDGWVRGDDQTIEGNTYTVFNNGNARLLVNTALTLGGNLAPTGSATMPTMDEVLQQYATTHTVDIRAFIEDLPPEDEEQKRKRLEDELAILGPLPAAKAAIELAEPTAVAEPETDPFDLPPLIPDDG